MQMMISPAPLNDDQTQFTPVNTPTRLDVDSWPNGITRALKLEVTEDNPIKDLQLSLESALNPRYPAITWKGAGAWNHPDADLGGLDIVNGALQTGFDGVVYDFNSGMDGWVSSSSSYGARYTNTCGVNGSSGGSLYTRGASVSITSPQINLAGQTGLSLEAWILQGSWGCGEEPDTNEDLYVEYKSSSNSWKSLIHKLGSIAGGTASQNNVKLPADAYHNTFQIRVRQSAGSGTCCDYWFIDDISLPGSPGSSWTSPSFGWASNSTYSTDIGPYGWYSIDAEVPVGASVEVNVLDAITGEAIPGWTELSNLSLDLSRIDWQKYSSLRLEVHLAESSTGATPKVHSISAQGRVEDSFHSYPASNGWNMSSAGWSSGNFNVNGAANGTLISPIWKSNYPYASITALLDTVGNGQLQYKFSDTSWLNMSNGATIMPERTQFDFQLKWIGSGQWSVNSAKVDFVPGDIARAPRIDIGEDGMLDWGIVDERTGAWGLQDTFSDSTQSIDFNHTSNQSKQFDIWVPKTQLEHFKVEVRDHLGNNVTGIEVFVGSTRIQYLQATGGTDVLSLELSPGHVFQISNLISSSGTVWSEGGIDFAKVTIYAETGAGSFTIGGLSIPWNASYIFDLDSADPLLQRMNEQLAQISTVSSVTKLPLPFSCTYRCSIIAEIDSMTVSTDVKTKDVSIYNTSQVLTPSWRWAEINSVFEIGSVLPARLTLEFEGTNEDIHLELQLDGTNIVKSGSHHLIHLHPDNHISTTQNGNELTVTVRFRIDQSWEDEDDLRLMTRLVLADHTRSIPTITYFGQGGMKAVDNDIRIFSHGFLDEAGNEMPATRKYLRAGEVIHVYAQLAFAEGDEVDSPRSGEVEINLYRDGTLLNSTRNLSQGRVQFTQTIPLSGGEGKWVIDIVPLAGGGIAFPSYVTRNFTIDPLAPVLIDCNLERYDHRASSSSQLIQVAIRDLPVLPDSLELMLWREWADDLNADGIANENEFTAHQMSAPSNRQTSIGNYTYLLDDSLGSNGKFVVGYVNGTDPAGNSLVDGGSQALGDHLFMYQVIPDGIPIIGSQSLAWKDSRHAWLHPGQKMSLGLDLIEPNGASDVDLIEIELASNILDDVMDITYKHQEQTCTTTSNHLIINNCRLLGEDGQAGHYEEIMHFEVDLELKWTLPDLGDLRREPAVTVVDRAGQTTWQVYPEMRWRFSTEMLIPMEDIALSVSSGTLESDGARMRPGGSFGLSGKVVFAQSLDIPDFDCSVDITIAEDVSVAEVENGDFHIDLKSPQQTGKHALTWAVGCLPAQGKDVTADKESVLWIQVDGEGPLAIEASAPIHSLLLEPELHVVEVVFAEPFGVDSESLELHWRVSEGVGSTVLSGGVEDLTLLDIELTGMRLSASALVDLSSIEHSSMEKQLVLDIWVKGRDLAGNEFQTSSQFNSEISPLATWKMVKRTASIELDADAVEYSREELQIDQTNVVQVHITNNGHISGNSEVSVHVVDLVGVSKLLYRGEVEIAASKMMTITVDWSPDAVGIQWIEVELSDGSTAKGHIIDVKPAPEPSMFEGALGDADSGILFTFLALILIVVVAFLMIMARKAAASGTSEKEYYEEEYEYVEDEEELEEAASAYVGASPHSGRYGE